MQVRKKEEDFFLFFFTMIYDHKGALNPIKDLEKNQRNRAPFSISRESDTFCTRYLFLSLFFLIHSDFFGSIFPNWIGLAVEEHIFFVWSSVD